MLALACDLRYAAPEAKFGFVFVKVGLSGADLGATFLLPRLVGMTKATELLMTGDIFDAAEAHRIGLVNELVPAALLLEKTRSVAVSTQSIGSKVCPRPMWCISSQVAPPSWERRIDSYALT